MQSVLVGLRRAEQALTTLAFFMMVAVLALDILGREVAGGGRIWATPIAVYANVLLAFIGMGVASAHGAHLRPRFFDRAVPARWDALFDRFSDAGFALFCAATAALCVRMVHETIKLEETDPVMGWPVWPFQCILVAGFAAGALRHAVYAARPELRPPPDGGENAPPTEEQVRELTRAAEPPR
jgi:TRAP-type C4-dicarboxylate transport system permease small subunit